MGIRKGYFELKREILADATSQNPNKWSFDDRVILAARRVYPSLEAWAAKYPIVLPKRLISMCVDSAAMCPDSSERTIRQSAVLCLILFAIDDLADGTIDSLTDEEVFSILALYADIARGPRNVDLACLSVPASLRSADKTAAWYQVAEALREFCLDLAERDSVFGYPVFAKYFVACMQEMQTECRWRRDFIGNGKVPTYQDYMVAAERSIGAPAVWGALLPLNSYSNISLATAPSELLLLIEEAVFAGARCIRLANDLRSFLREIEFEKKPNSVLIVKMEEGCDFTVAERLVLERSDIAQEQMLAVTGKLPPELIEWGTSVRRFCASIKDWYLRMELHDAPVEMERLFAVVSSRS